MNLQEFKSEEAILQLIATLLRAIKEGDGVAAFQLSIIYSPWSTLESQLKQVLGASKSKRNHYQDLALSLLEGSPASDLEAQSILEILRKTRL